MFFLLNQLPLHERRLTISTFLTITRILLTPIIVLTMVQGYWHPSVLLLTAAGVTDFLDGELARIRDERTMLGALLDPLADKVLMISCFMTLFVLRLPHFILPSWFVVLLLVKELIQVIGSVMVFYFCGYMYVQPTWLGKSTMALQLGTVLWILLCQVCGWAPVKTYEVVIVILMILVIGALLQYAYVGKQLMVGLIKNIGDRV